MPPDSSETIFRRLPLSRLQKQRVGEPYSPMARIVPAILPCEGPASGRRNGRRDVQHPLAVGVAKYATLLSRLGDTRLHLPNLRMPVHGNLRMPVSRRMASTAAMRAPIQRMTGTAIELPSAR
jgi:hypothetical protein